MLRNVASQKYRVYAWDTTTGQAKTGDAANISAYLQLDDAAGAATNDTAPTEVSSTNQPGYYDFDLTQAETNAAKVSLSPKSATANIQVVACPPVVYTRTQYSSLQSIDTNGRVDIIKIAGTTQTARDLGTSVLLSSGTGTGQITLNSGSVTAGTVSDKTGYSLSAGGVQAIWDALTSALSTVGSIGKRIVDYLTGDIFARVGAPVGASISADIAAAKADTDSLLTRLTATRAGYLDKLNISGNVAAQADITALNQSASRRIIITTVSQFERPESSSMAFQIEARTYDADGAVVDADSTPSLTATGLVSGSLAANLGAASSPATGVYRWTYTVQSAATLEQIRFDISATIGGTAFPLACYSQVADFVSTTFTTDDRSKITAVYDKLPSKSRITGTDNADGSIEMDDATGNYPGTVAVVTALTGHTPQTGDSYAIVNSGTFGNSALNTDLDTLLARLTGTRAGYLDNISAGAVATAAALASAQGNIATILGTTVKFETMIVLDGAVYQFTANAVELAPSGGGGGGDATAANQTTIINHLTDIKGEGFSGGTDSLEEIRDAIDLIAGSAGSGADQVTLNIQSESLPVADADVWVTSDAAGLVVVAGTLQTDSAGDVTFLLDDGVGYYLWMQKDGVNPIQGQAFTAEAD